MMFQNAASLVGAANTGTMVAGIIAVALIVALIARRRGRKAKAAKL